MSGPRFLADHDLNEHIVGGLLRQEPSVDVVRCREVSLENCADSEVLEYAAAHSRIVISHDVNTMPAEAYARLEKGQPMAGLVMIHQATPVSEVIESLRLICMASEREEWSASCRSERW